MNQVVTYHAIMFLDLVFHEQDVLELDVAMETTVPVHVAYRLPQLVHVVPLALFGQVLPSFLDRVVHIHLHQLKRWAKGGGTETGLARTCLPGNGQVFFNHYSFSKII